MTRITSLHNASGPTLVIMPWLSTTAEKAAAQGFPAPEGISELGQRSRRGFPDKRRRAARGGRAIEEHHLGHQ
jgi:hypothetical protein